MFARSISIRLKPIGIVPGGGVALQKLTARRRRADKDWSVDILELQGSPGQQQNPLSQTETNLLQRRVDGIRYLEMLSSTSLTAAWMAPRDCHRLGR
jgi:hypothetical protein